jgi:hypothetical protein
LARRDKLERSKRFLDFVNKLFCRIIVGKFKELTQNSTSPGINQNIPAERDGTQKKSLSKSACRILSKPTNIPYLFKASRRRTNFTSGLFE